MNWWQYLVLVNIYLLLFYGFYVLLLSRETFFQLNRIYLVAASVLSFLIPLIQSDWVKDLFITQKVKYTIYTSPVMFYQFKPIRDTQITIGQILIFIYIIGITFLIARFIRQLLTLRKIINQPQPDAAYSFFNKVRLGDELADNKVIAAHENVHASQWHSADVILIEAVMIINWFNPVVYLYRFAIKHIHEFIADRQAINSGTSRETYALLLLSQTFNTPSHQLVNPFFNHSLLKQRIIMLQKNNSNAVWLVKYCLSVPLFILMLILSSATVNNSKPVRLFNTKIEQVLLSPATGLSKSIVVVSPNNDIKIKTNMANPEAAPKNVEVTELDTVPVFTSVEQVPQFPGGLPAFAKFLGANIKYPKEAREKHIQGRVIISFVVEKDGTLSNIHVARGIDNALDEEAVRVLNMSPKWQPGVQNGKSVRVAYSVPIAFTLEADNPQPTTENKTGAVIENRSDPSGAAIEDVGLKADTNKKLSDLYTFTSGPPLYILDGKEIANLNSINPNSIERIEVIKDKRGTALYGIKGQSGVVLITTKKNNKLVVPVSKD